jgi:rRNA-processing protein FCF1
MKSSDDYISGLLSRYKSKGILIDTNVLLLYFVGMYDVRRIESFKRLTVRNKAFTIKDFELLLSIFNYFDEVVTTPNILTEVSNLSTALTEDEKPVYYQVFAKLVSTLAEQYVSSSRVCSLKHFSKFYLTDSGILDVVKGRYLALTADLPLFAYLGSQGIDVISFDQLRMLT